MTEQQIESLLGLAQRAGKIASGDDMVVAAIEKKKALFVLIAEDAAINTSEIVQKKVQKYAVDYRIWGTKNKLGLAIGKSPRAAVAVLDKNFTAGIKKLLMEKELGDQK